MAYDVNVTEMTFNILFSSQVLYRKLNNPIFKFLKEKFVIIPDEETNNNFLNEIERISMQSKKIFLDSLTEKELMKFVIPGLLNGQINV